VRQSSTGSSQHPVGHRNESGSSPRPQRQVASHQQRQLPRPRMVSPRPIRVNRNSGSGSHHG
jgi:hypothetical protein